MRKLIFAVISTVCIVLASDISTGYIQEVKENAGVESPADSMDNKNPYDELVHDFDVRKSPLMVRVIDNPTAANLDYAAYHANPILFEPQKFKPQKPQEPITIHSITFDSMLHVTRNSIDQTPLTEKEKSQPLAWTPLNKKLWEVEKDQGFQTITSKINGHKWADSTIYMPYQEITAAYLHEGENGPEIWVRVEFMPWVNFLDDVVTDSDGDSFREVYGKLNLEPIAEETLKKAVRWIKDDYTARVLSRQEVTDWITSLASYWYPTKNTDLVALADDGRWPDKQTEGYRLLRKSLKRNIIKDPAAVVKGKPFHAGNPLYNVFIVNWDDSSGEHKEINGAGVADNRNETNRGLNENTSKRDTIATATTEKLMDESVSANFTKNNRRFASELKKHETYARWASGLDGFRRNLKRYIESLPEQQMGIEGKDGWLFFRRSLQYTISEDLTDQSREKNPLPHLKEFKNFLDSNRINLLFVTVPAKSEVYPEYLPVDAPKEGGEIVNPYVRKFLRQVQDAGIEVIDLLPHFLDAKSKDGKEAEYLYQKHDTHWTTRGLQIAADLIAKRVREYSWYENVADSHTYTIKDTTITRRGDIVDKLPQASQVRYPAASLAARQVYNSAEKLNRGEKNSPVMVIGDSYTGVFEHIDCKGAGVGSHIAANTGIPVDIITSWGGGPLVRQKMLRARGNSLQDKRLVVYIMSARDLYDYSLTWSPDSSRPPEKKR